MSSFYDELSKKLNKEPKLSKKSCARFDISLLLFNARDSINELWNAAERYLQCRDADSLADIEKAVEKLRPLFGGRENQHTSEENSVSSHS